jgi:Icc-related predicted phosphoesterase
MTIQIESEIAHHYFQYIEVSSRRDANGYAIHNHKLLPILQGTFEHPKTSIDFLILCSDLQGLVKKEKKFYLMGEYLPSYLKQFISNQYSDNPSPKIGVFLCGDLFTHPDYHGADGDVVSVWEAFSESYEWVVGVAGNHDHFAKQNPDTALSHLDNVYFLHKNHLTIDGLRLGGISGIIGKPSKNQRVAEADFMAALNQLGKQELDILLLHSSPNIPDQQLMGDDRIRQKIEEHHFKNIISGHVHWHVAHTRLKQRTDIWNTDGRVLILQRI